MLRQHYRISTDIARVYKARGSLRHGWGWAVATIREWPRGGQIDVQSDFGSYAYSWGAIGDLTLREFLCGLSFDYFMNKAAPKGYRVFDEDASVRRIKGDIFDHLRVGCIDRVTAHEWRDDLDHMGQTGNEHLFAERLMEQEWFRNLYDDYPSLVMRDCSQARAFWDGPWHGLCAYWRREVAAERSSVVVI